MDCSVVYGSTPKMSNSLRAFKDGLLRAEIENGREFMPTVANPEKTCFKSPTCFLAGKVVVYNLTVMYYVWN